MPSKSFLLKKKICMNPTMNAPKSKGRVFEQSLDKYFELTESDELAKLVASIREAQDHDERRELKANLPFRCPHYFRFKDDRRCQASIIPEAFTWQTCIDIDDASQVAAAHGLFGLRQAAHRHPYAAGHDYPRDAGGLLSGSWRGFR